ncbi:MAG: PAS domain-containing sensor histidine kinase [Actinobacteria bacterium]|nr:PAS domain-containing sensor histidine kinase [Actinomycetota bacterium]
MTSRTRAAVDLDDLAVAAIVVDAQGRVEAANAAGDELAGRPPGGLVGCRIDEVVDADSVADALVWAGVADGDSGAVPERELRVLRPDGRQVPVMLSGRRRQDDEGSPAGLVLLLRPVVVDGASVAGMDVVSTVSHELRSPLTSVKGYTSLLLSRWSQLSDEQKKTMLEQVNHDADRVTRLVNELLDISRLETGHLQLQYQLVDLPAVVSSVVAKVALAHPALDCSVEFERDFPPVRADPDKIEQVLTNLVENAAKYGSLTGMRVVGDVAGEAVSVVVVDEGPGIPAADLPHLFTKFYRRDQARPSGSGLGLWISRGLVEAHGGQLTAASTAGGGSSFRFTLPVDGLGRR